MPREVEQIQPFNLWFLKTIGALLLVVTGRMPFVIPNQQFQSTDDKITFGIL